MSDQLRSVLDRIADQAGPGTIDPTLWGRARHARRVRRRLRVAAAAAVVVALVGLGVAGTGLVDDDPPVPPVKQQHTDRPAVPSTIFGVPGDGGLALETDLAVGRASVAIANATDAFVVTAADGAYHRLRLPGYDAASYDAGLPGIALSPDGTRLAYGFQSPARQDDGRPRRTGLRVLDLTTGDVWSERFHGADGLLPEDLDAEGWNFYVWNLRWSPDGRYVGASVALAHVGNESEDLYAVVDPGARRIVHHHWNLDDLSAPQHPAMVSSDGLLAAIDRSPARGGLLTWDGDRRRKLSREVRHLSTGRFSADGRWLVLAGQGLQSTVELFSTGAQTESLTASLPEARYPYRAAIDLLAWTGDRQVLAMLRPGTGPSTASPDAELAVLTLDPAPDAAPPGSTLDVDVDVVGRVLVGDTGSVVSVATDLVAATSATRDFDSPPFAPAEADLGSAPTAGGGAEPVDDGGPTVALTTLLWAAGGLGLVVGALVLHSVTRGPRHTPSGAGRA